MSFDDHSVSESEAWSLIAVSLIMSRPIQGQIHHRGAMVPLPSQVLQEHPPPLEDGYRTPTIEDLEHLAYQRASSWNRPGPLRSASQFVHSLQHGRPESPVTQRAKQRALDDECDELTYHQHQKPMILSWKKRVKHVTWAFFTLTMATGGIANALSRGRSYIATEDDVLNLTVPFRFHGLETIGTVIFLFNIVLYLLIWAAILTRFYLYPYTFRASFTHPTESLFVPAVAVSFGTILINVVEYGFGKTGMWLNRAVVVLFWFDAGLAVFLSVLIYIILYDEHNPFGRHDTNSL